jgi:hypothetical protein
MLNFKINTGELEAIDNSVHYKIFTALHGGFYLYGWGGIEDKLILAKEFDSVLEAINFANSYNNGYRHGKKGV